MLAESCKTPKADAEKAVARAAALKAAAERGAADAKAAAKARSVVEENVKRVLRGKGRALNEQEEQTDRMARSQDYCLADFRAPESGCGQERSVVSVGSETGANGSFDEEWVLVD